MMNYVMHIRFIKVLKNQKIQIVILRFQDIFWKSYFSSWSTFRAQQSCICNNIYIIAYLGCVGNDSLIYYNIVSNQESERPCIFTRIYMCQGVDFASWLGLWCLTPLLAIFQLYLVVSFTGGGKRCTRRKPPICRKSLANFIT